MKLQAFAALLPLVLFWAVEELYGLKTALIVGCVAAVAEIAWELVRHRKVSFLTLSANVLVLGFGAISFVMDSGVAFKLQPAVMEWGMGVFFIGMRVRGEPFLVRTFRETPGVEAAKRDFLLSQQWFLARLRAADLRISIFLLIHGLAVAWAAIWADSRTWILLKGVLFYVLLVLVMAPMYKRHRATPK